VNVEFDVIEWQVLLTAARAHARPVQIARRHVCSISARHPQMPASWRAYFSAANFSPNGFNFEQWKDDEFEASAEDDFGGDRSESHLGRHTARRHEVSSTHPPWLDIVHDLNPRAMSPKVKGFVSPPVVVRRSDPGQRAIERGADDPQNARSPTTGSAAVSNPSW